MNKTKNNFNDKEETAVQPADLLPPAVTLSAYSTKRYKIKLDCMRVCPGPTAKVKH